MNKNILCYDPVCLESHEETEQTETKPRRNTHISEDFLRILLLGATLSAKILHEYGPWSFVHIWHRSEFDARV